MADNTPALVVVAAGGLGTRVHAWARFIPKEFYPVGGRPGIILLLEEIAALGPARVAVVYHPYYEQFAAWARQVLSRHDHARYRDAAGMVPAAVPAGLTVSLIPQHGPYGDLTSVLNGAGLPVWAVAHDGEVIDLGAPEALSRQAPRGTGAYASPAEPASTIGPGAGR
jgi:UTP-glucose-1-phosphate uridylyltransferase